MTEHIYTIPLMDAFKAGDECPLCHVERQLEEKALRFTLGASYMEGDTRAATDALGFCRHHYKAMYNYGNRLGNALILSTRLQALQQDFRKACEAYVPEKASVFGKFRKTDTKSTNTVSRWIQNQEKHCYICDQISRTFEDYMETFFSLYQSDPGFENMVKESKGFCLHHFDMVMEAADTALPQKQREAFAKLVFPLMERELKRIEAEVQWFIDKYDYRNIDADWKNSKDAIARGMQKIAGGYPKEGPIQGDK